MTEQAAPTESTRKHVVFGTGPVGLTLTDYLVAQGKPRGHCQPER